MKSFPYKYLITSVTILLGLLIFREAISNLIFQTEEVTILDKVTIKVDKEESEALQNAQLEYQVKIAELTEDISKQKDQIISLQAEIKELMASLSDYKEVRNKVEEVQGKAQVVQEKADKIELTGGQLQEKSAILNSTPVLRKKE